MRAWEPGKNWYRIHSAKHEGKFFGPKPGDRATNRFDDPNGNYRICYLGVTIEASFAETLLRSPPLRILSLADLDTRAITTFRLQRPVQLVQMHSDGLAKLGLTADMVHGTYEVCGRLARTLWEHADTPDGIEYRSRHDDQQLCIALFNRDEESIVVEATEKLTDDIPRLQNLLRRYDVKLTR
jgi:hypothetical protein